MVNHSEIKTCKGCGKKIYFSGSRFVPTDATTNMPHKCIVDTSVFKKTSRSYESYGHVRLTEKAISNELDRIASKAVVGDAKLEIRVSKLETRVKELEEQLLEKHNEIMVLKLEVKLLQEAVKNKT